MYETKKRMRCGIALGHGMIAGHDPAPFMTQPLTLSSLPLFPLGSVLFPGGVLALRIFEVRYLDMVRKCHQTGAPFGPGAAAEEFRAVGRLAEIEELESVQPALLHFRYRDRQQFRVTKRS
jgi:Lon protease-like protein